MKIVDFEQGSSAWLDWRTKGITATDMTVIMGVNPYRSFEELYEIKFQGKEVQVSESMQRGRRYEQVALYKASYLLNLHFKPICVEKESNTLFRASLDGYAENTVLEIKVPKLSNFDSFLEKSEPMYRYQIYWQMIVSGAKKGILFVYAPESDDYLIKHYNITKEIEGEMESKALQFWETCSTATKNPFSIRELPTTGLEEFIKSYSILHEAKRNMKVQEQELREIFLNLAQGQSYRCGPIVVQKRKNPSTLNIERLRSFLESRGENLDNFLESSSEPSYMITIKD